jgi:hypothetical protein
MKTKSNTIDRLEKILEPDIKALIGISILRDNDHYVMYGNWTVWPKDHTVEVKKYGNTVGQFYNLKNAVSWCTAERYRQQKLALEIEHWDRELARISNDVYTAQELVKRFRDPEIRLSSRIKMEHNCSKLTGIRNQLEKCIKRAKYCQLQGLNDEIARTRRPTPIRTNR